MWSKQRSQETVPNGGRDDRVVGAKRLVIDTAAFRTFARKRREKQRQEEAWLLLFT
jgi:hypothetical protein